MAPTPLIIDTDPGIDDAFALALAAASPEVDLCAVTTVFGNVGIGATTENALRVLELCGRSDVPVARGAERPLVHQQPFTSGDVHGNDGIGGQRESLPVAKRAVEPSRAVDVMTRVLRESDQPVTIAAIGPLTNIALLLSAHPDVAPKIGRLVIMGGALSGGNVTASAEFNVWSDPEAARRVLTEGLPTVLVPLDLTMNYVAVDPPWLDELRAGGPIGATLASFTDVYLDYYRQALGREAVVLHDVAALAEAIRPGILDCTPMPLDVECSLGPARGAVIPDRRLVPQAKPAGDLHPIAVALRADSARLHAFLLERLAR